MVNYLHSISISATAFLEIVNVLLSAVAMLAVALLGAAEARLVKWRGETE